MKNFQKINANLVQTAGFIKACFSSSKIAREYIQILKKLKIRLILQAFRNLIFWFIFQFWMRMNLTKIGLLSKLIAGGLVFQPQQSSFYKTPGSPANLKQTVGFKKMTLF